MFVQYQRVGLSIRCSNNFVARTLPDDMKRFSRTKSNKDPENVAALHARFVDRSLKTLWT